MIIKSLYLKNFKSHKETKIEFSDKTLILGENGTGKSSIFHAIIFALFGSEAKEYLNVQKINTLIRHGSPEAKVSLELYNSKNSILIERTIRSDGSTYAVLKINDKVVANSPTLVNKKIKDILGIKNINDILDVLYIPQGELGKYIKLSGKKELTERLEKLFKIEYYSIILEISKLLIKDIIKERELTYKQIYRKEREIEKFRKLYSNLNIEKLESIAKEREELQNSLYQLKELYTKIKTLLESIDKSLISKESEYRSKLEEIKSKIFNVESSIINLKSQLSSLSYDIVDKELIKNSIEHLEKELAIIDNKLSGLDENEIELTLQRLETIYKTINEYIALADLEEKYKEIENAINNIKKEIIESKSKISDIKKILQLLQNKQITNCPVCGKPLSEEDIKNIISKKIEEYKFLINKVQNFEEKLKDLEKKYSYYKSKYNKYLALKEILIRENIDVEKVKEEKEKIGSKLKELRKLLEYFNYKSKLESAINYLKSQHIEKSLKELENVLKQLKDEERKIENILNKIEIHKQNLKKLNTLLAQNNYKSIEEIKNKIIELEEKINNLPDVNKREIELYKMHITELENLKKTYRKLKELSSDLLKLKENLEKFISLYRRTLAKKLSAAFNYYFKKLYIYNDLLETKISLKYERGEWKFIIFVKKNIDGKEIWKEIREAGLSGGQIKILDLAFRMALALLIKPNFNVIMLDEPTESLDENIRLLLADLLNNINKKQIILSTHDELFKDKIEGKIIELKR